jgi:outer membrane immunogenic protein
MFVVRVRAWRFLAVVLATSIPPAAFAADLPSRAPPPPALATPEPIYSWTGFYAGVGAGFGTDRYTFPYAFGSAPTGVFAGRGTIVSHGFIGGGQVGYNYQTPWNIVLGIEVEAEASGVGGHLPIAGPGVFGDVNTKVDVYGAFRARFGYAFNRFIFIDNVLVYVAAGGAFGSFRDNMTVAVGPNFLGYSQHTSRIEISKSVGSLGIGVAHPITPNLSAFIDYRYTALGPEWGRGRQISVNAPFAAGTFGTRAMYHLARVGLNWKFSFGE